MSDNWRKEYRNGVNDVKVQGFWTFWKIMPLVLLVVITIVALGWTMRSATKVGDTVVERMVFKQSFQYQEGMEQRARTLEAQIAEIDYLIASGKGDKKDLQGQKSYLKVQLQATYK